MSLNSEEHKGADGASTGGAHRGEQGPRLHPGGYATWRPKMEVHLDRTGADGVHTEPMTAEE